MRDWPQFVRDRLGRIGLDPRREEEIVAELAGHYEDLSEEGMGGGLSEESVMSRAQGEVRDWKLFRYEICRAELEEVKMGHRTKSLWLPGLITGAMTWFLYSLLEALGLHPRILAITNPPLFLFLPWLLALPVVGALGALGSRRAGGNSREMILAGIFPVLVMTALFVLAIPLGLTIPLVMGEGIPPLSLVLSGLAGAMLGWVIIPGAALLVGALPVATARRQPTTPSSVGA